MHFTTSTAVVLGFAVLGSSHMIMTTPIPYGKSSLTNSPLDGMGADFPCKQRSGVYDAQGASNSMALGSTQPLKFVGGATHGGGSCQISVTYDSAPSKSSKFKVIHSIIGGCPIEGVAGNNGESADSPDPSTYSFKIPSNLPTGNATLAWTWFNKIGNREMYMNCAPVTLTGASTKRDEEGLEGRNATQLVQRDQAAFDALPDMFVANLEGAGVGCRTGVSMDTIFPNPGDSVESLGGATKTDAGPPIGCSTAAGGAASGGSSSGATTSASGAPTSAPVAGSSPVASAPVAASSLPGGVFAGQPGGSSAASAAPTAAPAASSAPAASEASPAASQPAATQASSASTPASTGTTGSGSAMAAGAACSPEGTWNCIGGTQFQQCASGVWSAAQPVAGGTTCTAGQSASIDVKAVGAKRSLRKIPRRALVPQGFHA